MLPTFILGGTSPAGSGHLYGLLKQHPDVFLAEPMQPECNFFAKASLFDRGLEHYEQTWFSGAERFAAVGERSSHLFAHPHAPRRVREALPDVKMVFLLRHPGERAFAHYRFTALAGWEPLSFAEALAAEERRLVEDDEHPLWRDVERYAYQRRGRYHEQLARWRAELPDEQLLVLRSDALLRDLEETLARICSFLGVPPLADVEEVPVLPSPAVRDPRRQWDLRAAHPAAFDAAVQRARLGLLPQSELERALMDNIADHKPKLAPSMRAELAEAFRPSVEALRDMVDFDVEDWLP